MCFLVEGEFSFYLGDKFEVMAKVRDNLFPPICILQRNGPRKFFRFLISEYEHCSSCEASIDCICSISSAVNLTNEVWCTRPDERHANIFNVRSPFILRVIFKLISIPCVAEE